MACAGKYVVTEERGACHIQGLYRLRDGKQIAQITSEIQSWGGLCSTKLGKVNWSNVTTGDTAIWIGVKYLHASGTPDMLYLYNPETSLCAYSTSGIETYNGLQWLTRPEDPAVRGFGSVLFVGLISLNSPTEAHISINNVYLWPVK
jgi:hypothetical protein